MSSNGDTNKIAVARDMFEAWDRMDWEHICNLFAQNGRFQSMMKEPVEGRDNIRKYFMDALEGYEIEKLVIKNIGAVNGLVFAERLDCFRYKGKQGALPAVGILQIENGEVLEWREYFDYGQLMREMGIE